MQHKAEGVTCSSGTIVCGTVHPGYSIVCNAVDHAAQSTRRKALMYLQSLQTLCFKFTDCTDIDERLLSIEHSP